MSEHINEFTGNWWIDERIHRKARLAGLVRDRPPGANGIFYRMFDRAGYIDTRLSEGRLVVIVWEPSFKRFRCRDYQDVYGLSDLIGIEEIPTLFTDQKGMKRLRIYLIPYLITGYDIPPEMEEDPEPLVPFTAKTIELMKEIENEAEPVSNRRQNDLSRKVGLAEKDIQR